MPKQKKKFDTADLAAKTALWFSRETNQRSVQTAGTLLLIGTLQRTAVLRGLMALGYDKKTARKIRNGALAIPFVVGSSSYLGYRKCKDYLDAIATKEAFDAEQKKNQEEFDNLPPEVKEAAEKAAEEIIGSVFGPGFSGFKAGGGPDLPDPAGLADLLKDMGDSRPKQRPSAPPSNPRRRQPPQQ